MQDKLSDTYTRRWFLVLTRGEKVGIIGLKNRELLGLKYEDFWRNSRFGKHLKAP